MSWDKNRPLGNQPASIGDDAIRENFEWMELSFQQEHYFPENADTTQRGRHKFGMGSASARDAAIPNAAGGEIWYNTDAGVLQIYSASSTAWITASGEQPGQMMWMMGDTRPSGASAVITAGDLWLPAWNGDEVAVADFADLAAYFGATGGGGGTSPWDTFRGQAAPGGSNFRLPKLSKQIIYVYDPGDTDYDAVGDIPAADDDFTLAEANLPLYDPATISKYGDNWDNINREGAGGSEEYVESIESGGAYDPGDYGQATPDPIDLRQFGVVLKPWVHA